MCEVLLGKTEEVPYSRATKQMQAPSSGFHSVCALAASTERVASVNYVVYERHRSYPRCIVTFAEEQTTSSITYY